MDAATRLGYAYRQVGYMYIATHSGTLNYKEEANFICQVVHKSVLGFKPLEELSEGHKQ